MKRFYNNNKISIFFLIFLLLWCTIVLIKYNNVDALKDYDAITVFFYILAYSSLGLMQILAPIFIIIMSVVSIHSELHSGMVKNILVRISYKKYIKKFFFLTLSKIWFLPLSMLFLFLGCVVITKNIDVTNAIPKVVGMTSNGSSILSNTISPINTNFYDDPLKLMLTFFIILGLHSIFYSTISLIICKKNKNIIVSIISTFLCYIGLCILSEIVLSKIFVVWLNFRVLDGIFNLLGIWIYCDFNSLEALLIYSIIIVVISYLFLFISYKNKEKVLIDIE